MTHKGGEIKGVPIQKGSAHIPRYFCDLHQRTMFPATWRSEEIGVITAGRDKGFTQLVSKGGVTVIFQDKEAAGAEVAVEFDENLIGGGGHALLH